MCQVVRLYNVVEIGVMSGEVARCSVVCVELWWVKVMSSLICVMSPLLVWALCMCVWWCSGVFLVLAFCVSFVSCILMMSGWMPCTRFLVPRFCL